MDKCAIVKDLLPLYADEVCSFESKKFVAEHLNECDECCKELESFTLDVKTTSADEKKAVKTFKKKTERKVAVKVISVILAVCIGVFGALSSYWYFRFRKPIEDLNGLANDYMFESNDNISTIDIILGENNSYGIDTAKYEDLKFNGAVAEYLQNNAFFEVVIRPYSHCIGDDEIVYEGAESLEKTSVRIRVKLTDNGKFRYIVNFDPLINKDLDDLYFLIDEDMNLILEDPVKHAEETYKSWSYMGDDESKAYVMKKTQEMNDLRTKLYDDAYEDLRVMMIVLHEGFGIGNVKA